MSFRLLLFILCISHGIGLGQSFHSDWETGFEQVLNLSYSPSSGDATEAYYLNAYHFFLVAVLDGNDDAYEAFFSNMDTWEDAAFPETSTTKFINAELEIMSGFLKLKFGHELSAAWSMRSAYRIAQENYLSDPENSRYKKSWGLMQVLVGAIPENYQWVPELFGIRGTIPTGISLLESIPSSDTGHLEGLALIQLTRSYLLNESSMAASEFSKVMELQPESPILAFLYLNLLQRAHDSNAVIQKYQAMRNPMPLSTYVYGTALLQDGQYDAARNAFVDFSKNYEGSDFRKDAVYKVFLSYHLEENEKLAYESFSLIESTGSDNTEADRYAKKAASKPWPQIDLMEIRLATDGGFYSRAQKLLDSLAPEKFRDPEVITEYYYRKARLAHFSEHYGKAETNYLETISRQKKERWYYAPNACLQLGYIYLEQGKMEEAEHYFKKVKDYRGYEYQKGIERKAHSALTTHFRGS